MPGTRTGLLGTCPPDRRVAFRAGVALSAGTNYMGPWVRSRPEEQGDGLVMEDPVEDAAGRRPQPRERLPKTIAHAAAGASIAQPMRTAKARALIPKSMAAPAR